MTAILFLVLFFGIGAFVTFIYPEIEHRQSEKWYEQYKKNEDEINRRVEEELKKREQK